MRSSLQYPLVQTVRSPPRLWIIVGLAVACWLIVAAAAWSFASLLAYLG